MYNTYLLADYCNSTMSAYSFHNDLFPLLAWTRLILHDKKQTLEFLSMHAEKGRSPLCGNSISHDRRFLRRYMPELDAYFHYRNVDVSSIKELIKRWNPELLDGFKKSGGHRAMEDVLESIQELKFYRDKFFVQ